MSVVFCFCFLFAFVVDDVLSCFFLGIFIFGFACMFWFVLWSLISVVYVCSSGSVAVVFSSEAFNHFEGDCHGSMHGLALFLVSSYCRVAWIR